MPIISEISMITCKEQQNSETLQNSLSQCDKPYQVCNTNNSLCEATIPITAIPIKVTNMQNPYIMRAYEIKKHSEKLDKINRKLLSFVRSNNLLKKNSDRQDPKLGDMVLIQSSNQKHMIELPSFICRGMITHIENTVYNVLFVDHGTSFELSQDQFCIVPHDFISDKYLTKVIVVWNKNCLTRLEEYCSSTDVLVIQSVAEGKWSDRTIQFVRDLLITSQTIYFDHVLTDDKNNREYGEFYLIIDNIVVSLSEALIIDYHATYLKEDVLPLVKYSNQMQHKKNTEEVIRTKFSTDRINKNRALLNRFNAHDSLKKFCLNEKIVIHSTENCGVLNNVADLGFPSSIHKAWEKSIKSSRSRKLQSYIWPAIKKGLNVVAIGSSQCGKTSACVMAICGLVAMRQKELSRNATRPLALILCSSSFEVINVQSLCMSLLNNSDNTKCVAAFNGKTDRSIAAAIYNGCQILVTTPRYLVRFLNENSGLLTFDRLFYLVLDNADIILDKYYNSVGELFKKHNIIKNREPQGDGRPLLQIIISATYWTSPIKKFVHLVMYNPYICIASFIEAVVFKSVHPKIYILKSAWKNKKISDILQDDYMTMKTLVACTNAEEAEELNVFLLSIMKKKTLLIHEKMKLIDMQNLQERWKSCLCGSYPILICTDEVLSELSFTDIQWLIHHSVLLKFKNQFNYRFSVLLDDLIQNITNCKVSIIIDENNSVQFQSILKIMMRMKVVISPELQENFERMAVTLERDKKNYAICDNVKAFGFCQERNICVFRHYVLSEVDEPISDIQINDKVKLMVMHVHDTSHFSARVIEHIPHSNKKTTFSNVEYIQIMTKLQQYYQNIENRKICTSTDVGDVCVLEESFDTFKRVQIRCIRYDTDSFEKMKFVDVRCIDSGVIHQRIDVRKLIHIPEELLRLSTHTMEVFLTDIAPYDEEYIWNRYSNNAVHKWLSENFNQRSYIIGKVRLHLGNTIWLDDLEIGTKLIGHSDLIGFSLKKHLISGNYAVSNKDHIPQLFKLCKNSGFTEVNGYDTNICK